MVTATQARTFEDLPLSKKRVWYTGDDAVQIGEAFCFDSDRGTAGNVDGHRANYVERPSASNNLRFAGVNLQTRSAMVGGQSIEIAEPGSYCLISVSIDTVVDTTYLTCIAGGADAGRFREFGLMGRGSALAYQTNTSGNQKAEDAGGAVLDSTGKIMTVSAGATANVKAGDLVYIYAGEDDNTNAVTPGKYVVASVTNDTTIVLTSSASDGATMQISYYIIRGNPLVMAYLFDGEESGLIQFPVVTAGAVTTVMTGGTTSFTGNFTLSSDMTDTLDTAKAYPGMKKRMRLDGALTSNQVLISAAGFRIDGSTSLSTIELDADDDEVMLHWNGTNWILDESVGVTLA